MTGRGPAGSSGGYDGNTFDSQLPRWNGDPAGFKRYHQEVRIYRLRKDMTRPLSFAAELVTGLSGSARICALQMPEAELVPYDTLYARAAEVAA